MASKPAPSRTTATTTTTSSVRRNLFHHHLSRRPTSSSTASSATTLQSAIHDDSTEIVAKDRNGNYAVQVPTLPPLEDEQVEEEMGGSERDSMFAPIRDGCGGVGLLANGGGRVGGADAGVV